MSGAGPRHIDFHPRKPLAFVINERDSTITTCRQDTTTGELTPLQTVPSAPSDFTSCSTGAEIWVNGGGRNGLLALTRLRTKVGSPACVVFSR